MFTFKNVILKVGFIRYLSSIFTTVVLCKKSETLDIFCGVFIHMYGESLRMQNLLFEPTSVWFSCQHDLKSLKMYYGE